MDVSARDIVEGLAHLWQNDILCDITLHTEGESITAHRALLAASSPFFQAMFGGNFKEANDCFITLDKLEIPFERLSVLIKSLYTLKLDITKENCLLVTMAANVLQFPMIMPPCIEFLQNNIDNTNCLQLLKFGDTFGVQSLKQKAHSFLLENFISVSQNPDFVEIDRDCLLECISDTRLCTGGNEIDIYRAVMKWIKFNPIRSGDIGPFLQHIRFHLIPEDLITDEIAKELILQNNSECVQWLKNAIEYHASPYIQPFLPTLPPRGKLAMFMVNQICNISWNLVSFPDDPGMSAIVKSHCPAGFDHWSDVISFPVQNFMYLLYSDRNEKKWCHVRYDAVCDKWLSLAAPHCSGSELRDIISAAFSKSLFICGGWKKENDKVLSTSYLYSIDQNIWTQIADSPEALFSGLSCVHNECVFITSFYTRKRNQDEPQMLMYDSNVSLWQKRATPLHCHFDGIFATVSDKLFIAGGNRTSAGNEYQMTAEVYDIKTDQWTDLLTQQPNLDIDTLCKIENVQYFVLDKTIYCFGHYEYIDDYNGHDSVDFENVNLIFDTGSGQVSHYSEWDENAMDMMGLVIVPIERFTRTTS